jgi:hypothetical protein
VDGIGITLGLYFVTWRCMILHILVLLKGGGGEGYSGWISCTYMIH